MARGVLRVALAAAALALVAAQTTTCAVCVVLLTLVDQLTGDYSVNPESLCKDLTLCDGSCTLFNGTWPVTSPVWPTDGGVVDDRRLLRSGGQHASTGAPPLRVSDVIAFARGIQAEEARRGEPLGFYELVTYTAKAAALAAGAAPCDGGFNISCDISRVFDAHLPLGDHDGDNHAPGPASLLTDHLRGANWRGRDCNDNDATIYPGRRVTSYGPTVDHNCNGIVGSDAQGNSYEDLFCSGANAPMGLAILGDSATAHFHLPPQYINALTFNLSGVLDLAANEADWPQCSWGTGYRDDAACPTQYNTTMGSLYQRMRARNLCMHRDFANLGVNGARTGSMAPPNGIVNGLQRDPANDAPLMVFHSLIGNDVCNGHPGSGSMTTVPEFRANVLSTLTYLDTVLPAGSHVAFIGLVDGRVLFDTTHTRTHPLGVGYPNVYEYLSCSNANPCWGWLNTNQSWRDFTSERAANLTAVYDEIIANKSISFRNFDMYRVNVDWFAIIGNYTASGLDPMHIIEPVDGFHPSQTGNMLLADVIWQDLTANKPEWLPPVNPFNDQIQALFGDQGGY